MRENHSEELAVTPNPGAWIKRILLVDDSSTSRMTARMLLADHESYVLSSMRGEETFVRQAYANGCNDFLTKPVNEQKLAALIRKYLGS